MARRVVVDLAPVVARRDQRPVAHDDRTDRDLAERRARRASSSASAM